MKKILSKIKQLFGKKQSSQEVFWRNKFRKLILSMIRNYQLSIEILESDYSDGAAYGLLANMNVTFGICHYITHMDLDNTNRKDLKQFLQLYSGQYLFEYKGFCTINGAALSIKEFREISIKLCQMRLDYLKKFL